MEIHIVMFVFSTQLCELLRSNVLSGSPLSTPPLPCVKVQHIQTVCGWEVLSPVGDHILQEFNTLYLIRFRTYKIARPPQTKTCLRKINTYCKVPLQVNFLR